MSESYDDILMNAMQAARTEGLVTDPSAESGQTDVHKESSEAGEEPDDLVQEHLQEESKKEAKDTQIRMMKVALQALLTAGDSCLAVERVNNGR